MTYRQVMALSKTDLNKRLAFTCKHRHNGVTHSPCFDRCEGNVEKIGYLDIETSNLTSDFGVVLSYCIKCDNGKILGRTVTPFEVKNGIYDKVLLQELCLNLKNFTRIVTYYGSKFDIPFIRSRCLLYLVDFPWYNEIHHTDAYIVVKHKFTTLHSRRLGVVAPFYGIASKGHPLNPTIWLRCLSGNKKALSFVFTHNKEDVISLEKLWHKIRKYTRLDKTSI